MDFTYEVKTKDPDAISKMFFLSDIYIDGGIKGFIKNSSDGFNGNSNVDLKNFHL